MDNKDTGLKVLNIISAIVMYFVLLDGFIGAVLSFLDIVEYGLSPLFAFMLTVGAEVFLILASRRNKKFLIGHIVLNGVAEILYLVGAVLLLEYGDYGDYSIAAGSMLITVVASMMQVLVLAIVNLCIRPRNAAAPQFSAPAPQQRPQPAPVQAVSARVAAPAAAPAKPKRSVAERAADLRNLKELLDMGVITPEEYEVMRAEIMAE